MKSVNQIVEYSDNFTLCIKREDLIHPFVSGNKFRKLKYNLIKAQQDGHSTLLTFGGAFSNHIAAVAYAGQVHGLETVGVIRGEELHNTSLNPTLKFATVCGMKLKFISRELYRKKSDEGFLNTLALEFGGFYLLPEGGTNELAVAGCEEILTSEDFVFDYICCAAGTGGTAAGIINSSFDHQKVLVFPAVKGDFVEAEIAKFTARQNWSLIAGYEFEGYAKLNTELIIFINKFYLENDIPLEPIYTGKMMFGVIDLISKDFFPKGSKILAIHTGGLQGIAGMNRLLRKKNLPLIEINV